MLFEEVVDFFFAIVLGAWIEFAEELEDLIGFEVDAFEFVIGAAAFDGGPFDDVAGGRAKGIAHIGLLEDFFVAGASTAIGDELFGGDVSTAGTVDGIDEAEVDGVEEGDAEVEVPGRRGGWAIFDF